MIIEPVSLAIISACGWIGILARNYYTQMLSLAVERSRREGVNEQERVNREREQFDIVFQNLLTRVQEERETIQTLITDVKRAIERSSETDEKVAAELAELRRILGNAVGHTVWDGVSERRSR